MRRIWTTAILTAVLASLGQAGILYVDDDASPGGNGQSWATAFRFLEEALHIAATGDELHVGQGTYLPDRDEAHPNGTADPNATFLVPRAVQLFGGYAGLGAPDPNARDVVAYPTALTGDLRGDGSVLSKYVIDASQMDANSVVDGFIIMRGVSALINNGGVARLVACRVNLHQAPVDYAAIVNHGTLVLEDCTIENNAGIGMRSDVSVTARRCSIALNAGVNNGGGFLLAGTAELSDCTFLNNAAWAAGGGLHSYAGTVAATRCTFRGNVSNRVNWENEALAGGITARDAVLTDCTFENNYGRSGGGALLYTGQVNRCRFIGNHASAGGGLLFGGPLADGFFSRGNAGGAMPTTTNTVTDSVFIQNTALAYGGGVCFGAKYTNCWFQQNSAEMGGAIYGGGLLANGVFIANSASYVGAALYVPGLVQLANCSFVQNVGPGARAVYAVNDCSVSNSVLWDGGEELATSSGRGVVNYSNVAGGWSGPGIGNINVDPLFGDPNSGDLHLLPGSPCIDAGDNLNPPRDAWDFDQDGCTTDPLPIDLDHLARYVDDPATPDTGRGTAPIIDMGAYEFGATQPPAGGGACPGDLNCDGAVDFADINPFVLALTDPAGYQAAFPNCFLLAADCDNSGALDFYDINSFVSLLTGP